MLEPVSQVSALVLKYTSHRAGSSSGMKRSFSSVQ